jgi:type IV pilus assembly protein PilQ
MRKLLYILFYLGTFFIITTTRGQDNSVTRIENLRESLEVDAMEIPHLHNKVSTSISGVSLNEFLRGLAIEYKLNLNIDPALDTPISLNFTDIEILDLLVYISKQYSAEILLTGKNILSVMKYTPPHAEVPLVIPKKLKIYFDPISKTITYDLQGDTLGSVVKYITQLSGYNVLTTQKLQNTLVGGYVENMDIKNGLMELARINNLQFSNKDSTTFYFDDVMAKINIDNTKLSTPPVNGLKIVTNKKDSILSVQGNSALIKDVLSAVASRLNINYFIMTELKGSIDIKIENVDFNTFLKYLFNATEYTYRYKNGIYLIGERKQESIRTSDVYKLMYRTTVKILEVIPSELKKGIEIIPIIDLNSIIISGSAPAVNELESFLRQIDKSVPVINIELTILDISKSHDISTGISAGLNNTPTTSTYSSVFPNVNVNLGSNTINSIIGIINGTGLVNLGSLSQNFYLSLQASENNGLVKILSTPRLAALNGTEAQMTIGETRYYAETSSNIIATQSTTTTSATIYKPLQANLSITIKPIVSGDEQITMDVTVDQGSFTSQIATNGPFGQTTRNFKSSIRVKNNDVILLGGLEQKNNNNTGQGFPILANIPVIKWLFSTRSSKKSKSKLAILIHPTIIY